MKSSFFSSRKQHTCKALILLGNFNHTATCWKSSKTNCKPARKLLACTEDNFLIQVIESPTRGQALLDLLHSGPVNSKHEYRLGNEWTESSPLEKNLGL